MTYDEKQLIEAYRCASHVIREEALGMLERSAKREEEKIKTNRKSLSVIQGGKPEEV